MLKHHPMQNVKDAWRYGLKAALDILTFGSPDVLVFWMSLGGFFWGLWLALPWGTFDSTPTFALMAYMAPEIFWGVLLMVCCALKLVALLYIKDPRLKIAANFVMFLFWGTCTLSFALSNWQSTATVNYFFFCVASAWSATRRYVELQGGL